jgi:hypothetical protein
MAENQPTGLVGEDRNQHRACVPLRALAPRSLARQI